MQSSPIGNRATLVNTMRVSLHKPSRAGVTQKVSVSMAQEDLALLRRRARKLYGGNLSAAVGEGVRHIREQEGREALVRWLGRAGHTTETQRRALRAEWQATDEASRAPDKR
jgi:hypothetical protein